MSNIFQPEKDTIVLLGLLSIAYRQFDEQFHHPDDQNTHTNGLNIFAAIVDNTDGEILACKQNNIHQQNNPMLHAEQLTLKAGIEKINQKRPRDVERVSVETYYRNYLFNDPASTDYLHTGCTIYTTLEPCPFCTSALLVTRMKRIIFIIPDSKFGNAYEKLKDPYYKTYDITYQAISIIPGQESELINFAASIYNRLMSEILQIKQATATFPDTLLLDFLKPTLKNVHDYFMLLTEKDLITTGEEKLKNINTLNGLK